MNTLDCIARRERDGIRIQLISDQGNAISAHISDANAIAIRNQLAVAVRIPAPPPQLPPDPVLSRRYERPIDPPSRL